MSEAWKELGALPQVIAAKPDITPRLLRVKDFVCRGKFNSHFNSVDLIGAIKHCGLDPNLAVAWAAKHISWAAGWEVKHQRPYQAPPPETVRDHWEKIPLCYLTEAEFRLSKFQQRIESREK